MPNPFAFTAMAGAWEGYEGRPEVGREPKFQRAFIVAPWLLVAALGLSGCAGEHTRYIVTVTSDLPPYTPAEAAVFDDSFAPELLGLPPDRRSVALDPKLIERTQKSNGVVRAKLTTVTRDASGRFYLLSFRSVDRPYAGEAPEGPVDVRLAMHNPAVPRIRSLGQAVIGKTLVLFLRKYNDRGEISTHFRAESDTPQVRDAIARARLTR